MCRLWSGRSHHRYLKMDGWSYGRRSHEGLGSSLLWVKWALDRAISFDLEPIFIGPLLAGHALGDFGDFMGLTHNSLLKIQDPEAFARATPQVVPFPEGLGDDWFHREYNRSSVVYEVNVTDISVPQATAQKGWGSLVLPPSPNSGVCRYSYQVLRDIYWSAPRNQGRCRIFLRDGHGVLPAYQQPDGRRSWVLAVHVRRGDVVTIGARPTPHKVMAAAVASVLRSIAATNPAAYVSVLVFSQGNPSHMNELQLPDEHGQAVTWDISRESCLDVGLDCSQVRYIECDSGVLSSRQVSVHRG